MLSAQTPDITRQTLRGLISVPSPSANPKEDERDAGHKGAEGKSPAGSNMDVDN